MALYQNFSRLGEFDKGTVVRNLAAHLREPQYLIEGICKAMDLRVRLADRNLCIEPEDKREFVHQIKVLKAQAV